MQFPLSGEEESLAATDYLQLNIVEPHPGRPQAFWLHDTLSGEDLKFSGIEIWDGRIVSADSAPSRFDLVIEPLFQEAWNGLYEIFVDARDPYAKIPAAEIRQAQQQLAATFEAIGADVFYH